MKGLYTFTGGDVDLLAFNPFGEIKLQSTLSLESTEHFPDLDKLNSLYYIIDPQLFQEKINSTRLQLAFSLNEFNNLRPTPKSVKLYSKGAHIDFEVTDYAQTKIIQDLWSHFYKNNRTKILNGNHKNIPFLAKSFGANLLVKTSDNSIVITKRSKKTRNFSGLSHVSTSEGSSLLDVFGTTVDLKNIFVRSAREELGVDLDSSEIQVNALFLALNTYQYGLSGYADLTNHGITSSELKEIASKATDAWENEQLITIKLSTLPSLLEEEKQFIPFGFLTLLLNLHNLDSDLIPLQSSLLTKYNAV